MATITVTETVSDTAPATELAPTKKRKTASSTSEASKASRRRPRPEPTFTEDQTNHGIVDRRLLTRFMSASFNSMNQTVPITRAAAPAAADVNIAIISELGRAFANALRRQRAATVRKNKLLIPSQIADDAVRDFLASTRPTH